MIGLIIAGIVLLFRAALPGTKVVIKDQPSPRSSPTDTGVWFLCGLAEKGPVGPKVIQSMSEYATYFGQRVAYGLLYDSCDAYFREGGRYAYISRVVGPGAVIASHNLLDGGAAVALTVKAENAGDWGNNLKVAVVAGTQGGTYQIQISDQNNVILEQSGDLVTPADAVNWSANSNNVNIVLGASGNVPAVAALAALTAGTDDRTNITDAQWQAALDLFSRDLGPGQVSYPGRTTLAAQNQLLNHAQPHNRVALVDLPDSGSRATLAAAAVALRGLTARFAGAFAPWAIIPGVVAGTTRTVPYSAIQAGMIARNDVTMSADDPSAGEVGQSQYAIGLSQLPWNDSDRGLLNDAGVNVALIKYGGVRTYGYRTLVNKDTDPNWVDLSNSRLIMEIAARADAIMETFAFSKIDGQGRLFSRLQGQLVALCMEFFDDGSLYGSTASEAFFVDTGSSQNTPVTIAANEIHANVALKVSPFGEVVELDLVKVAITDTLG